MKPSITLLLIGVISVFTACKSIEATAQQSGVPDVFTNVKYDAEGKVYVNYLGEKVYENNDPAVLTLERMKGNPKGTATGIKFNFGLPAFTGEIHYGFIPYDDSKYPQPVYRGVTKIDGGMAQVDISKYKGAYDMIGWEESGKGTLGYRVVGADGLLIYDGIVSFRGKGPFKVDVSITDGPTVNMVTDESAVIAFTTNEKIIATVVAGGKTYSSEKKGVRHEIPLTGLTSSTEIPYSVNFGENTQSYSFKTSPKPGSRKPFTFAYASDSRSGVGGGERDLYGTNAYIMKKIMALCRLQDVAFMQFSGDLINGYLTDPMEMDLQYANWKRAIEPFAHYFPVYVAMGNHESLGRSFTLPGSSYPTLLDRFPFNTESGEASFAKNFVNHISDLESEDGASYDPNPKRINFPSYKETVYSYTYDNVAVIVLNSDYLYTTSASKVKILGGNIHAYIMDEQFKWLEKEVMKYEQDENIDHVFLTQHTPFFPNGGHVGDDMWYGGDNSKRPYIAGKPLEKGIIERRDQMLDLLANKAQKPVAILTGDEHNYALTTLTGETNIYPEGYTPAKINVSRTLYQVNNGAAGAPYYAQEQTPWTPSVSGFSTQNALVLFEIDGKKLTMKVLNPDTLEEVDEKVLR